MPIRLIIAFVFIAIGAVGHYMVQDMLSRHTWQKLSQPQESLTAFSAKWAERMYSEADALASDQRLQRAAAGDYNPIFVRRALYEYTYLKGVHNVYAYLPRMEEQVIQTLNALPLADTLKETWQTQMLQAEPAIRLLAHDKRPYIHVMKPIRLDGQTAGLAVVIFPLSDAMAQLRRVMVRGVEDVELFLVDTGQTPYLVAQPLFNINGSAVYAGSTGIDANLQSPPVGISRWVNGASGLIQYRPVMNAPQLGVGIYVPALAALKDAIWWLFGVWCLVLLTIISLFAPELTRFSQRLIEKMSGHGQDDGTEGSSLDYLDFGAAKKEAAVKPSKVGTARYPSQVVHRAKTPEQKMAQLIRESLEADRTRLLFQPVMEVSTNQPVMVEVFLRILDENYEALMPAAFLPAARRYKLLRYIDAHVLQKVIDNFLQLKLPDQLPMAINLGVDTFDSLNFLETLMERVEPGWSSNLVLEIRSKELIEDPRAIAFVKNCQELGCRFAVDYFGGGTAMLRGAKRLQFDYVKVDSLKFIKNEDKKELVRLTRAAQEMGLSLILERVESEEMVTLAKKLNVQYAQGYYFSRPEPQLIWKRKPRTKR